MGREQAFQKFVGTAAPPKPTSMPSLTPAPKEVVDAALSTTTTSQEAPAPKQELDSSRLAILAKKEAALQKEREAYKKERDEWLAQKAEADKVLARAKEFNEISEKDKIAALKMIGWSETDILNAMAGAEKAEPTAEEIAARVADEKLQAYKDEQTKLAAEAEKTSNQKLIETLKSDISSGIKSKAEEYELCSFEGKAAEAQAYEFIVETLKESGELISVDEALSMTEALYEERAKALQQLKKLQPKAVEVAEPPSAERRGRVPVSNTPVETKKTVGFIPPAPTTHRETRAEKKERLVQAILTGGLTR